MASGCSWASACAVLGLAWTLAAAWRARAGVARTFLRCALGGGLAVAAAACLYEVVSRLGGELRWEALAGPGWGGVAAALRAGTIEESAKLAGIALALRARAPRPVARATVAVAALFAIGEAFLALEGGAWPVALGRALLAPVAHAALAIPCAWALARPGRGAAPARRRVRDAARIALALGVAASLHALGDWSLARGAWGQAGFALATSAPVLWLYAVLDRRGSSRPAPRSVIVRARRSSATPQACAMQPRGV